MKYIISNETLTSVVKVATQVKKPDSKVVLTLGSKDMGENVACALRLTTDAEQINYNFVAKKPEDFDGSAIVTSVDAAKFISIVESVLSFSEDIYIELSGTILEIGILGKVKTSLPIESQIPEAVKPLEFFYRYQIGGTELNTLLTKGMAFTEESVDERGCHNAIMKLYPQTDEIKGFSTDGHTVACSKAKAQFAKADGDERKAQLVAKMEAAVTEYCTNHTEQNKDAFNVIIPREAVQHLSRFAEGQKSVTVFVDSRFMHVQIGGSVLMYTIKQAGSQVISLEQAEKMAFSEATGKVCVDSSTLIKSVSFINKNNAISGISEKLMPPVKFNIEEGQVLMAYSGVEDKIESAIKTSEVKGSQFVALNGKKFEAALSALNKGNVVLNAGQKHVTFFNGTIDAADVSTWIFVFQINIAQYEKAQAGDGAVEEEG